MAPTEALSEVSDLRAVATGAMLTKRKMIVWFEDMEMGV
jgi:hypothetical protein